MSMRNNALEGSVLLPCLVGNTNSSMYLCCHIHVVVSNVEYDSEPYVRDSFGQISLGFRSVHDARRNQTPKCSYSQSM